MFSGILRQRGFSNIQICVTHIMCSLFASIFSDALASFALVIVTDWLITQFLTVDSFLTVHLAFNPYHIGLICLASRVTLVNLVNLKFHIFCFLFHLWTDFYLSLFIHVKSSFVTSNYVALALRVRTGEWNEEDQCKDFLLKTWRSYALHENDSYDNDYGNVFMKTILIIQSRKNVSCRHGSSHPMKRSVATCHRDWRSHTLHRASFPRRQENLTGEVHSLWTSVGIATRNWRWRDFWSEWINRSDHLDAFQ